MQDAIITFEQPLNEYIRVCLRLEHLFKQVAHHIAGTTVWECRKALEGMLEALNIVDRPDLKSKISQALSQHANFLTQLEEKPHVDKQKLQHILVELNHLTESLYKSQDKMGHQLRNNYFLNTIRQHMSNPGGACDFSTPAYYLWLQHPPRQRNQDLQDWFAEFEQLRQAVKLLLQLTRGSTHPQSLIAPNGFYQQTLDPKRSYHLVRVTVPELYQVYPEISVGKHRLNVRFLQLNTHNKPLQTKEHIAFELTCCMPWIN